MKHCGEFSIISCPYHQLFEHRQGMSAKVYSLLVTLAAPFAMAYLALRGLRDRAYLEGWRERVGFGPVSGQRDGILLHAASVGEFNAALPLIRALLKDQPDRALTISTLTPTGAERVTSQLGDTVSHSYLPMDLPGAVARFLGRVRPRLIIVMETEIWPNFYLLAHRLGIPLVIANARLSARSARRYQRLPGLVRHVLQTAAWVGAQSAEDVDRLERCGARHEHTVLTGNLKFELEIPTGLHERAAELRSQWSVARPVLVAGSTHEADEDVVIPAFAKLLTRIPNALLILVPRHPERFVRAAESARTAGLIVQLHSQGRPCSPQTQCLLIDAMGELMTYYACADVAFVGGSFGLAGGHNPLEPAALGKPVLFGPDMVNPREIADKLIDCGAGQQVDTSHDLTRHVESLLASESERKSMGHAGLALIEENRGALEMTLQAIARHLC